jgi:DNA-binding response OmpR family regulator
MSALLNLLPVLKYVFYVVCYCVCSYTDNDLTEKKKKILVVDDEPDICFAFKKSLEEHGFNVDAFVNPQESLQNFKPGIYDLVILDIKMPQVDGFTLYKQIRRRDRKVKVCFITASEEYYKEQFLELKKEECFMQKPIPLYNLLERVNVVLGNR